MKKILAVFFTALLSFSAFAVQDYSQLSLYFGLSFPQIYNLNTTKTDSDGNEADSESYSGFGLNFGGRMALDGSELGVFMDGNWYFPYSYQVKYGNTTDSYKVDESNTFWGIEGTFGAYYVLLNAGALVVPVGAGLHLNYINNDTKYSSTVSSSDSAFSVGVGGFINAELQLSRNMALFGSLHLNYDFWQKVSSETKIDYGTFTRTTTESDSSSIAELYVEPVIGLMWRF